MKLETQLRNILWKYAYDSRKYKTLLKDLKDGAVIGISDNQAIYIWPDKSNFHLTYIEIPENTIWIYRAGLKIGIMSGKGLKEHVEIWRKQQNY